MADIISLYGDKIDEMPREADECIEEMVKELVDDRDNIETLIILGCTKDGVNFLNSTPLTLLELVGFLELSKMQALLGDF